MMNAMMGSMASGSARQRPAQSGAHRLWDVGRAERCQRPGVVGGEIEWDVVAIEVAVTWTRAPAP